MFGRAKQDGVVEGLASGIEDLTREVAGLRSERDARRDELSLLDEIEALEKKRVAAEVELDRVREKHARETREIEHKIGLHRQRVEQEIELAKREQIVTVQEENLQERQARFDENMRFMRDRMEGELTRLSDLTAQVLDRLPTVNVDRKIRETIGANGNGEPQE